MRNKRIVSLLSIVLVIFMIFCTLNINSYAANDSQSDIFLYGFGDDHEDDDFLTLYNTKTCYVSIRNIPSSEKENINLTVKDEDIAEVQEMVYGDNSNPVITAKIKGKKLGTTDIIASLTYNGVNYTSKITTTVHESNYRISLRREDGLNLEDTSIKKNESMKLVAILVYGMSSHVGDISSNGAIWSSNNENVASVDNNGFVTAIGKGTATITVKYETNEGVTINASCNIEVKDENNSSEEKRIRFYYDEPGPTMDLKSEDRFTVWLKNIPNTEKENIEFKIENENIAKITKIEYGKSDTIVHVKYLSVGKTKLIATLKYNGETYSDSYDLDVIESNETLKLSANGYNDLPKSLKSGDKLQLTATLEYERGSLVPRDVTTDGTTWTSSNEEIAKVDNKGLVTAIGEGTANITAEYKDEYTAVTSKAVYTVTVEKNAESLKYINILISIPGPTMDLKSEDRFSVLLQNIPNTEKENIELKIENENIAKITKIEYGKSDTIVHVKYLSVGKTKLIATLKYNGETYSDSYDLDVIESNETLKLSANGYNDLPNTLKSGDKLQLTATLEYERGSLVPRDVTTDGTTWTSSNEEIAKVDNKGLVTAIGEGTVTITAEYKNEYTAVTSTYNLKITDLKKVPANNTIQNKTTTSQTILPDAGKNDSLMIIGTILILLTSMIMYKKHKNYKDVK